MRNPSLDGATIEKPGFSCWKATGLATRYLANQEITVLGCL